MKISFLVLLTIAITSCAQLPRLQEDSNRAPASVVKVVSTPKAFGFIFLGKIKTPKYEAATFEFALSEDLERNRIITPETSPIGDFILRAGTVVKLTKNATMYNKAPTRIGGIERNSSVFLKEGTSVRILQYDRNSLVDTIAVIEVVD